MRASGEVELAKPINPDVELRVRAHGRELTRSNGAVLVAIALGGGIGSVLRYLIATTVSAPPGMFPWGTFLTNVVGCLLIGVLMVVITEVRSAHRLVRPFLGIGLLGGFTTFSIHAEEVRGLLHHGSLGVAIGYVAATLLSAMLAVLAGVLLNRIATGAARTPGRES
jgi:fluoride exporter